MSRQGVPNKKTASWPTGHRQCLKCKQVLPFSAFHKHKQCAHGINTVCKTCRHPLSRQQWHDKDLVKKIVQRTKSRARQQGIDFELTEEDIVMPEYCPVFGVKFIYGENNWTPSIDRIDPTKGYVKGNVQIISNKANRMKSDATLEDLKLFATWIEKL